MASANTVRAGRAYVELFAKTTEFNRQIKNLATSRELKRFSKEIERITGDAMKRMFTFSFVGAFPVSKIVKDYAEFDDKLKVVQATTRATGKEFENLTNLARKLGRETSFTSQQVASGMMSLGRAGLTAKEIEESLGNFLNLSRATATELPRAIDIATATLRGFNAKASESEDIVDVLAVTANSSAQTLDDLGESFKYIIPFANSVNLSIRDVAKAVAMLANLGIKGSMAATSVRNILLRMSLPNVQKIYKDRLGVDVLDKFGELRQFGDIMNDVAKAIKNIPGGERLGIFRELFGMYGLAGGAALASGVDFEKMFERIEKSGGEAANIAQQMDSGIGGTIRLTISKIHDVSLTIGKVLTPQLTELGEQVKDIANRVNEFIQGNSKLLNSFVEVAKGISAVIFAIIEWGTKLLSIPGVHQTVAMLLQLTPLLYAASKGFNVLSSAVSKVHTAWTGLNGVAQKMFGVPRIMDKISASTERVARLSSRAKDAITLERNAYNELQSKILAKKDISQKIASHVKNEVQPAIDNYKKALAEVDKASQRYAMIQGAPQIYKGKYESARASYIENRDKQKEALRKENEQRKRTKELESRLTKVNKRLAESATNVTSAEQEQLVHARKVADEFHILSDAENTYRTHSPLGRSTNLNRSFFGDTKFARYGIGVESERLGKRLTGLNDKLKNADAEVARLKNALGAKLIHLGAVQRLTDPEAIVYDYLDQLSEAIRADSLGPKYQEYQSNVRQNREKRRRTYSGNAWTVDHADKLGLDEVQKAERLDATRKAEKAYLSSDRTYRRVFPWTSFVEDKFSKAFKNGGYDGAKGIVEETEREAKGLSQAYINAQRHAENVRREIAATEGELEKTKSVLGTVDSLEKDRIANQQALQKVSDLRENQKTLLVEQAAIQSAIADSRSKEAGFAKEGAQYGNKANYYKKQMADYKDQYKQQKGFVKSAKTELKERTKYADQLSAVVDSKKVITSDLYNAQQNAIAAENEARALYQVQQAHLASAKSALKHAEAQQVYLDKLRAQKVLYAGLVTSLGVFAVAIAGIWAVAKLKSSIFSQTVEKQLGAFKAKQDALLLKQEADKKKLEALNDINLKQEEFNKNGEVNNELLNESIKIVEELQAKYGDLGIEIDKTTGKITGLVNAQSVMDKKHEKEQIELDEEHLQLLRRQIASKQEEANSIVKANHLWQKNVGEEGYDSSGNPIFFTKEWIPFTGIRFGEGDEAKYNQVKQEAKVLETEARLLAESIKKRKDALRKQGDVENDPRARAKVFSDNALNTIEEARNAYKGKLSKGVQETLYTEEKLEGVRSAIEARFYNRLRSAGIKEDIIQYAAKNIDYYRRNPSAIEGQNVQVRDALKEYFSNEADYKMMEGYTKYESELNNIKRLSELASDKADISTDSIDLLETYSNLYSTQGINAKVDSARQQELQVQKNLFNRQTEHLKATVEQLRRTSEVMQSALNEGNMAAYETAKELYASLKVAAEELPSAIQETADKIKELEFPSQIEDLKQSFGSFNGLEAIDALYGSGGLADHEKKKERLMEKLDENVRKLVSYAKTDTVGEYV